MAGICHIAGKAVMVDVASSISRGRLTRGVDSKLQVWMEIKNNNNEIFYLSYLFLHIFLSLSLSLLGH